MVNSKYIYIFLLLIFSLGCEAKKKPSTSISDSQLSHKKNKAGNDHESNVSKNRVSKLSTENDPGSNFIDPKFFDNIKSKGNPKEATQGNNCSLSPLEIAHKIHLQPIDDYHRNISPSNIYIGFIKNYKHSNIVNKTKKLLCSQNKKKLALMTFSYCNGARLSGIKTMETFIKINDLKSTSYPKLSLELIAIHYIRPNSNTFNLIRKEEELMAKPININSPYKTKAIRISKFDFYKITSTLCDDKSEYYDALIFISNDEGSLGIKYCKTFMERGKKGSYPGERVFTGNGSSSPCEKVSLLWKLSIVYVENDSIKTCTKFCRFIP